MGPPTSCSTRAPSRMSRRIPLAALLRVEPRPGPPDPPIQVAQLSLRRLAQLLAFLLEKPPSAPPVGAAQVPRDESHGREAVEAGGSCGIRRTQVAVGGSARLDQTRAGISVRIPGQTDHRFRSKPITDSDPNRSPIPVETDHPESGLSDAGQPRRRGILPAFCRRDRGWRTGGCPCGRFERCCGCTSPRR